MSEMDFFQRFRTDFLTKINWILIIFLFVNCSRNRSVFADQFSHSSDDRIKRSTKDNPDPNIALEGQCVVVCDADVVGLKSASTNSDRRQVQADEGNSNTMSSFWDKISAPDCEGFVNVGRRDRQVAFSVKRSIDLTIPDSGINSKTTVTFDHVLVNVGNGFNMDSSTFVAPVSGVYSLYFQVYRLYDKNQLTIDLHVNGIPVLRGFADGESANHNSAHNSGMIHLVALDRVDVKVSGGNLESGWKYSTFSGYLVFEDDNF